MEGDDHNNDEGKESLSGADEEKESNDAETAVLGDCGLAIASPSPTIKGAMQAMFIRLLFSHILMKKLGKDQGTDFPMTLASLSDHDITAIYDAIERPGGLVSGRMPDRRSQISILAAENLKLAAFMSKMMEQCHKPEDIYHVNSRRLLES